MLLPWQNKQQNVFVLHMCLCVCTFVCACYGLISDVWFFFPVLQRVEEFHERYNDTRSLVSDVKEQFHEYDMKLSDLEETVNQAFDYVIRTEDMNQENTANLQKHEVLCSIFIISICE